MCIRDSYFTPLTGVLFTFPSRYWFTIGHFGVFSLTGWSRQIHAEFLVFRITRVPEWILKIFAYATITLYGVLFHTFPLIFSIRRIWSHDPNRASPTGLG